MYTKNFILMIYGQCDVFLFFLQNLVSLKTIDLQESRDLIEIPDLFMAKKLERVYLNHCKSLYQIHLNSKSLYVLDLLGCSSLKEFTVTSEEMIDLMLSASNYYVLIAFICNALIMYDFLFFNFGRLWEVSSILRHKSQ